jgi:hypothetical protein
LAKPTYQEYLKYWYSDTALFPLLSEEKYAASPSRTEQTIGRAIHYIERRIMDGAG